MDGNLLQKAYWLVFKSIKYFLVESQANGKQTLKLASLQLYNNTFLKMLFYKSVTLFSLCLCPSAENKATLLCYHKQRLFLITEGHHLFSLTIACHLFTAKGKQLKICVMIRAVYRNTGCLTKHENLDETTVPNF